MKNFYCSKRRFERPFISTAMLASLNWRAFHRPETAKHAAIARFRFQDLVAIFAFVKELTGICRHRLGFLETAFRAGDARLQNHCFADCPGLSFLKKPPRRNGCQSRPNRYQNTAERLDFRQKSRRADRAAEQCRCQKGQPTTTRGEQKSQYGACNRKIQFSIHRIFLF